eukprot:m51a1_g14768 putative kinesin-associated protein 3 isoform x1 (710) ;mRNA; f:373696-376679
MDQANTTVKKRIKAGEIEADSTGSAVVVNYVVEASLVDLATRAVLHTESKRIPVRLTEHTDVPALAREIIDKCKYVNPAKEMQLIDLLERMRDAVVYGDPSLVAGPTASSSGTKSKDGMSKLAELTEMLYDKTEVKIAGAEGILQLAQDKDNLEVLAGDETLLGILARVLRDDAAESVELGTAVVSIFFCFSTYSVFHPTLIQHRVGEGCFKEIENELKRRQFFEQDLTQKKLQLSGASGAAKEKLQQEYSAEVKKFSLLKRKQDQLLAVCFHVLLNMAEDSSTAEKMVKRGLFPLLLSCVEFESESLLLVVIAVDIGAKITRLLSHKEVKIRDAVVRLFLNLSFSPDLQKQMIACGCVDKLVALIPDQELQTNVLRVLYQLSLNESHRQVFLKTTLQQMIIKWPESKVGEDVIGLAVNLASHPQLAEQLLVDPTAGTAAPMVERFLRTKDPLLLKMLHNCTHSPACQSQIEPHIDKLVTLAISAPKELIIDLLGIIANMDAVQIDWAALVKRFQLLDFLSRVIQQYRKDDSIMTEVIAMLGTVVGDRQVATSAARVDIVEPLVEMLPEKRTNEPLLIQLLHTMYKLVLFKDTRRILLTPRFSNMLLEFYCTKNSTVRTIVGTTLDLVMECDPKLADVIRSKKFELHNSRWLQAVTAPDAGRTLKYERPPPEFEDEEPATPESGGEVQTSPSPMGAAASPALAVENLDS